ncbi:MAG: hypothetical protein HZC01_05210 [Candidatus Kerfeldbacteria bacterium]|nr:hypothetical protein [Candidatus Kerfeldbacteria bacterium]
MREKTAGYIVAALGLVAGLAWNDAVRALIDALFPLSTNALWMKFVYAIVVTLLVVAVSVQLLTLTKKE